MGRRSDHTRAQLRAMIVAEGHRQLSEVGFAQFSAREVAKRVGYSIGTIYNVFGDLDQLMLEINGVTLEQWRSHIESRLTGRRKNRLRILTEAYFEFAGAHRHAWSAIYDHRLPHNMPMPVSHMQKLDALTQILRDEVSACLPHTHADQVAKLSLSLVACVHGHCSLALNGSLALLGEQNPVNAVMTRIQEALDSCSKTTVANRPS